MYECWLKEKKVKEGRISRKLLEKRMRRKKEVGGKKIVEAALR